MALDSLFIPRPPVEFPPLLDDPGAATPATGAGLDEGDVVGRVIVPANDSDVVGTVVVVDAGANGAGTVEGIELGAVESLL